MVIETQEILNLLRCNAPIQDKQLHYKIPVSLAQAHSQATCSIAPQQVQKWRQNVSSEMIFTIKQHMFLDVKAQSEPSHFYRAIRSAQRIKGETITEIAKAHASIRLKEHFRKIVLP